MRDKEKQRAWELKNRARKSQLQRERRAKDNGVHKTERKERYAADKERVRAVQKEWNVNNADKLREMSALRRAKRNKATPPWLSADHRRQIKAFHAHANDCRVVSGQAYHVDHVVPIKHPLVCGLHVPWNLQVLPQDVNDAKGAKFDGGW